MRKQFDVIIAGAGSAGLSCARTAAAGGLKVLLIDRRRPDHPGHDWCDVVEKDVFQRIGLDLPPAAMWRPVTLPRFTAPDMTAGISGPGEGMSCPNLYIDRKEMNRWLLDLIGSERHIDIQTGARIIGPEMKGPRVTGVRVAGRGAGGSDIVYGECVVDASGLHSVIGSRVPCSYPFRPDPVSPGDVFIGLKEIIRVDDDEVRQRAGNRILVGYGGGMAWTMAYWENLLDVGVAVPRNRGAGIRGLLDGLKKKLGLAAFAPVRGGAGLLPARRCRTRLAGDGFLIAGDAACQINPSNGGGISPALLAGHMAGETLVDACRSGRVSVETLWRYPVRYMTCRGAAYAGLDEMRLCFQSFGEKEIGLLFKKGIIHINDLAVPFIDGRRAPFRFIDGLKRAARGRSRPDLLARLARALVKARALEQAYRRIPAAYHPSAVARWERSVRMASGVK